MSLYTRAIQANRYFQTTGLYPVPTKEEEAELASKLVQYRNKVAGLEDGRVPEPALVLLEAKIPHWTEDVQQLQLDMAIFLVDFIQEHNRLPDEQAGRREKVFFNFLKRMAQRMRTPSDGPVFSKTKELLDKNIKGWVSVDSGMDMAITQYMVGLVDFRGRTPMGC
jgi:hypothetical protein